jgi:hypothetical protein
VARLKAEKTEVEEETKEGRKDVMTEEVVTEGMTEEAVVAMVANAGTVVEVDADKLHRIITITFDY